MRNKRAAIELSATAIVILILAIVMLGLGLGFIRGMFGKVQTQFEEQIAAEPEPPEPSGSEPITLSRETIVTHAKDAEVLKVGLYNPTNSNWTSVAPYVICSESGLIGGIQVNAKNIGQGESDNFNYLFTVGSKTDSGTYLCYAGINKSNIVYNYTKDFTIRVMK